VTGSAKLFGTGREIADELRAVVKRELDLTISVGVSFNKVFAKLGSDMKKPDAITIIKDSDFKEKVWPLPAADLLYVGPATSRKLLKYGIHTIGELASTSFEFLVNRFGKWGEVLWAFSNGKDSSPVSSYFGEESLIKSIGNSTTTPRDLVNNEDVKVIIFVLSESIASRMRDHGFKCRTISIYVRDNELASFQKQTKLEVPSNLCSELAPALMELFLAYYRWPKPLRSIGVRGSDFISASEPIQLNFSGFELKHEKESALEKTVDVLRNRFGNYIIQRGLMLDDQKLSGFNPKGDHVIHPVGYFG
jgi:DNA polymerase-4